MAQNMQSKRLAPSQGLLRSFTYRINYDGVRFNIFSKPYTVVFLRILLEGL
jgi:hypothetical protein